MRKIRILWTDDEVEGLKPHIFFLEEKGYEIAYYLIKPVKPKQVLLAIKKILDQKRLVTEKTTTDYRQEFSRIGNMIAKASTCDDWAALYRKLIFWESALEKSADQGMWDILRTQENEA